MEPKKMKSIILSGLLLGFSGSLFGQSVYSLPARILSTNIGIGKAGTGDIYGVIVGFEYEKHFRPKLSWSTEFATSIHDGSDQLLVTLDNQPQQDMSYRYTTAGIQLAGKLGYHFVRTKQADFGIKLGILTRYQSSSLSDDREILFPALTGYPLPVRILRNTDPQRTLAAGALLQLFARYTFKKNILVGATAGFQMDTNGDVIFPAFAVTIGKRF
ncbi:hypothetical protein [Dyadobacter sp. CY356]|uniref:hypothetical protein n=1 Tax=Dyadobacter sp. CY356 TaxID=2906442 RepID=UPI001F1979EF|nr:hypothetical protein [Dyadobacter sp. CY356]MCF0054774.1 hypothetical protein [Dyadobacter sp. CY356]